MADVKPDSLGRVWPRPFRKLNFDIIRHLSDAEFFFLCRLVYRRNRKHQVDDRQARSLVRRLIRRRSGLKMFPELRERRPDLFYAKYKANLILDSLCPDRERKWINPSARKRTEFFKFHRFSFVDEPNETMHMLHDIASAECDARAAKLDFGDIQIPDIAPYVVWGLMSKDMAPFLIGGKMTISVQKVIEAVNLRQFMMMNEFTGLKDNKDVWAFPLRQRNPGTPTAIPAHAIGFSKVADELVDTVDEWLSALPTPFTLTKQAKSHVNKIVTEILENAERHSRPDRKDGDWYVAGFMARRAIDGESGQQDFRHDCHIAIVNLGATIADNILNSSNREMKQDLDSYIRRHRTGSSQSDNALATLYAMQDGVSSLPEGAAGKGMMDMVEFTNTLGHMEDQERLPKITVISGRSCIRFAAPYNRYLRDKKSPKRLQPFNAQNRLDFPPDVNYVFDLDFAFPGTIVALRFSLDHTTLKRRINAGD